MMGVHIPERACVCVRVCVCVCVRHLSENVTTHGPYDLSQWERGSSFLVPGLSQRISPAAISYD